MQDAFCRGRRGSIEKSDGSAGLAAEMPCAGKGIGYGYERRDHRDAGNAGGTQVSKVTWFDPPEGKNG